MITLDIGCGQGKTQNSIGVDITKLKGVDVIGDIHNLPFKDCSVDKILCYQLIHLVDNFMRAIEEMHRVLKKEGGKLIIEVPHVKGIDASRDPLTKHFFTVATMNYFTVNSGWAYYSKARFKIVSRRIIFKNKWCGWLEKIVNLRPEFAEHFLAGNLKPHIHWELEKE